jgi:hypothetical protein
MEIIPLHKFKLIPDSIKMLSGSSLIESKVEVRQNQKVFNTI